MCHRLYQGDSSDWPMIDSIHHSTVPRQEYKADIASLHMRINDLERIKQDKVQDIRIDESDNEKSSGKTK